MANALYVYDFTLSVNKSTDDQSEIIKILQQIAKKWCFQKEDSRIHCDDKQDSDEDSDGDDSINWSDDDEDYDRDIVGTAPETASDDEHDYDFNPDIDSEDYDSDVESVNSDWSNDGDQDGDVEDGEHDSDDDDADGGFIHWQGRISLIKKKRLSELVKLCKMSNFYRFHWSPTSKDVSDSGDLFYVQKADSRIDGPWSSIDPEPAYIPRQIRMITELRHWQQEVVDNLEVFDTRSINVIYDPKGNIGKSTLSTYCGVHGLALSIPPLDSYKDIMNMVMDRPISTCYFIDMPRSLPKTKLNQFYSGIEELKNGHAWDARYHFKEKYFDSPYVWLFVNIIPDKNMLSRDRWIIWEIRDNKLEYYEKPDRIREEILAIDYQENLGEELQPLVVEDED